MAGICYERPAIWCCIYVCRLAESLVPSSQSLQSVSDKSRRPEYTREPPVTASIQSFSVEHQSAISREIVDEFVSHRIGLQPVVTETGPATKSVDAAWDDSHQDSERERAGVSRSKIKRERKAKSACKCGERER